MNNKLLKKEEINHKVMIALFFDSGKIADAFYGGVVFQSILKGKEILDNSTKVIISTGDVFGDAYQDISPYLIKDGICSVDFASRNNYTNLSDWPYCWIIEDIDLNIALLIDKRLKEELSNAYKGMTTIDTSSSDVKKQFWKLLPRSFSIENNVITVFSLEEYGFAYYEKGEKLGFKIIFDEMDEFEQYDLDDIPNSRSSSFVNKWTQLENSNGRNDIDRNIHEMSFSLVKEVSIAGAFIWKSIEDIDKMFIPFMKDMPYITDHIFTSLYEASQGIERLQKVIVELIIYRDKTSNNEYKNLEKLLMSHNHMSLNDWIVKQGKLQPTSKRSVRLLQMLYDFYNQARYLRFGKNSDQKFEATLLKKFAVDCNVNDLNDKIKNLFGKALGELSRVYYDLIHQVSSEIGIFTYEISVETPAYIVFRNHHEDNLYEALCRINQAKKEVIWWIAKNPNHIIKEKIFGAVDYLDFDPAMINNYLDEMIVNRKGSSEVFDEVDEIYDESFKENKEKTLNRMKIIDAAVANINVYFEEESDDDLIDDLVDDDLE